MREIKFRALDENDKWIYGMPLTNVEHEEKEFPIMRNCDETGYWGIKKIHPKTLGQYTGLKDRNGVEIYEGDVVSMIVFEDNAEYLGYVVFENGCFCLNISLDGTQYKVPSLEWKETETIITVIGNIYENKELLERESK